MAVIDIVGKEALPNLYFDRIELLLATDTTTYLSHHIMRITFSCYDSKKRSWFNRPEFNDMKIKIVGIHDHDNDNYVSNKQSLDQGINSLFEFRDTKEDYRVKVSAAAFNLVSEEEDMDKFSTVVNFEIPAIRNPSREDSSVVTSNISLYAGLFIDSLTFTNDVFNIYYGPTSSEVILINGEPNQYSQYFYFADTDEEYGGPVHQHEGVYMEGSSHTSEPHRELRMVVSTNYKLEVEEL